ncbi:Nn.00g045690.m01.CDS01 [Neocucurbitaria sp. VM-36]
MPKEKSKKTKTPESVPDAGDPDRKRVLNVLAQRRYRQRRREKIAALEAQAKGIPSPSDALQHNDEQTEADLDFSTDSCSDLRLEGVGVVEEITRMPPQEGLHMFDFDQDPFGLSLMQDFNSFPGLPSPIPSTPSPAYNRQSPSLPPLQFPLAPDGAILSIPILSAIRTFASIAVALDVATHIWDPCYLHVLPQSNPALASLPINLHPVAAQHTIPHHPVLDLLPWPSVREKLICMLSMPSAFRPPVAQEDDDDLDHLSAFVPVSLDPLRSPSSHDSPRMFSGDGGIKQSGAIVRLVQDLDDFRDGGGVRVHGNTSTWSEGNELVEEAWEVGDVFYRKWWWCLDQRVVEASNRRRGERGLGRLTMVDTK